MGNTDSKDSSGLVSYINGETTHHGISSSNYREITIPEPSDLRNGVLVVKGYKTLSMERPQTLVQGTPHRFKILHSGEIKTFGPEGSERSIPFETAFILKNPDLNIVVAKEKRMDRESVYHVFRLSDQRSEGSERPFSFSLHEKDKTHIHSVEINPDTKELVLKSRQYMYRFKI